MDPGEQTQWFKAGLEKPRAVVVVIHGLNLKPSRMNPLVRLFQESGADVLRVTLPGHRGSLSEMRQVTRDDWLNTTYESYQAAAERARELRVPLYFVGYSLGALINADMLVRPEGSTSQASPTSPDGQQSPRYAPHYDRAVLLAPAITPKFFAKLTRFVGIFGKSLLIPSKSPPDYRSNPGTSVAAYLSLLDAAQEVEESPAQALNIPTLVFLDPNDELVNEGALKDFAKDKKLDQWTFVQVSNEHSTLLKTYHHLIIDEQSLGHEQWLEISRRILEFLR